MTDPFLLLTNSVVPHMVIISRCSDFIELNKGTKHCQSASTSLLLQAVYCVYLGLWTTGLNFVKQLEVYLSNVFLPFPYISVGFGDVINQRFIYPGFSVKDFGAYILFCIFEFV